MKIETAIKVVKKESEFLGLTFKETMAFIQKNGPMVVSAKVIEAYREIMFRSTITFQEI